MKSSLGNKSWELNLFSGEVFPFQLIPAILKKEGNRKESIMPVDKLPVALEATIIQKGQVLNPNGMEKGYRHAKTVVREFMDGKIKSREGAKISRFDFMVWEMFLTVQDLYEIVEFRKKEVEKAQEKLKNFNPLQWDDATKADKEETKLSNAVRSRTSERERTLNKYLEAYGKLSEFYLKASGQYLEKKEIENRFNGPLNVQADKRHIEAAIGMINDEL